jgi:hypothetical protein
VLRGDFKDVAKLKKGHAEDPLDWRWKLRARERSKNSAITSLLIPAVPDRRRISLYLGEPDGARLRLPISRSLCLSW